MRYTSLDTIVSNVLLNIGKPIHWYIQCFNYAKDCMRELHFDITGTPRTVLLEVDDLYCADLPDDYVAYTKIGVKRGQLVRPLVLQESINRLPNRTDCEPTLYKTANENVELCYGNSAFGWETTHYNDYGENIGRFYGLGAGFQTDTYKILPERGQIQFSEFLKDKQVVLEYISDGMSCDAATCVHPYAQSCIEDYIKWQLKENSRSSNPTERRILESRYNLSIKRLRARKSPLTPENLQRILQQSYSSSPKNY